ncbi:hypothetical protein BH24ACI5_BH24ACI5_22020 [soil metagenome]
MTKTQLGAVAMVVGCMAGPGTYVAAVQSDRPPMVVKGGSVRIELHPVKGMSKSPDWVEEGAGKDGNLTRQVGRASLC